jgi:hypothetical protein
MLQDNYGEFRITSVRTQHDVPPHNFAEFVLSIGRILLRISMKGSSQLL